MRAGALGTRDAPLVRSLLAANPAMARILGFATAAEAIGCADDILEHLCPEPARCAALRQFGGVAQVQVAGYGVLNVPSAEVER